MSRLLALTTAVLLAVTLSFPLARVINPGALQMLFGSLQVACVGCLVSLAAPSAGSWLVLAGLGQAYLLAPLTTPLVSELSPIWGDSRYGLVALQFGAAAWLGMRVRRAGHRPPVARLTAALYLSVPSGLPIVAHPDLAFLSVQLLVLGLLAWAPVRVASPILRDPSADADGVVE